jgi:hypothetical protein
VRIFKTKEFARFARKVRVSDEALVGAAKRAERGLIYADLGGGLIKQQVGARGAYRTIVAWRKGGERCFFVLGFAKSDKENLTPRELVAFQKIAAMLQGYSDKEIKKALTAKELVELK